jgi:6-pyruvoyltetrahydropterin/6-carboxytetrahydropterin synthase
MPTLRLTQTYHFSASHRLHLPQLSDADNQALFGRCNNPFGHGHNYVLQVSVEGELNPQTGQVVDLAALNELVQRQVVGVYDHKYINQDLPEFATLTATTENIAVDIRDRLRTVWPAGFPALAGIGVQETKRNVIKLPVNEGAV